MSRTTEYRRAVADKICRELAAGKSLRIVCAGKTMPSFQTVLRWVQRNADFRQRYGDACEQGRKWRAAHVDAIRFATGQFRKLWPRRRELKSIKGRRLVGPDRIVEKPLRRRNNRAAG